MIFIIKGLCNLQFILKQCKTFWIILKSIALWSLVLKKLRRDSNPAHCAYRSKGEEERKGWLHCMYRLPLNSSSWQGVPCRLALCSMQLEAVHAPQQVQLHVARWELCLLQGDPAWLFSHTLNPQFGAFLNMARSKKQEGEKCPATIKEVSPSHSHDAHLYFNPLSFRADFAKKWLSTTQPRFLVG